MTTTVTREILVVRRGAGIPTPRAPEWCSDCAGPSWMLTPDDAATAAGVSPQLIREWVADARLHTVKTSSGALLICLNSLPV